MVKNIKARGNIAPGKLLRCPHQCLSAEDCCGSVFYCSSAESTSRKIQVHVAGSSKKNVPPPCPKAHAVGEFTHWGTKPGRNTPGVLLMPTGKHSSHKAAGAQQEWNHQGHLLPEEVPCPHFIVLPCETRLSWQADSIPDCS